MNTIKIGSRDSLLAVAQANSVIASICEIMPQAQTALVTMKTTGDRILDRALDQIGGKGLFVKELDRALETGEVDFTVHSLKDMPMETADALPLIAFSARADARDVLILPAGTTKLDLTLPIGCSSARRRLQLAKLYPGVPIAPVRGNVQTRLRKLDSGEFSALVLAAAGLHRLGLERRISRYFSPEEILPAAGQAIIVVQGRRGEDTACVAGYHNEAAAACAYAERAFVRLLDGGCSSPVAAYAEITGDELWLRGMYVTPDESAVYFGERRGAATQAETIGKELAQTLRTKGAHA